MRALEWAGNVLRVLDQTRLPFSEQWIACHNAEDVARTIETMQVRGAPAIGAAAAFGVALESLQRASEPAVEFRSQMEAAIDRLAQTRPTAVNLFWALKKAKETLAGVEMSPPSVISSRLVALAESIAEDDIHTNRQMAAHGANLFTGPVQILTHCNTGSLATVEYGTALGVVRRLHEQGKLVHVWVDETRPYLQGARLTAFELASDGIHHTLITDNMAGYFMNRGQVDAVIVGADRIASNGDTANKIGTYSLAVLAKHHGIPFYIAAPLSTFDMSISDGERIEIEQRDPEEVLSVQGQRVAPLTTHAAHPAFDVTPHELIEGIITEAGVVLHPDAQQMRSFWHQTVNDSKEQEELDS